MKLFLLFCLLYQLCFSQLFSVIAQPSIQQIFLQFRQKYQKSYVDRAEQTYRLMVFLDNFKKIEAHNQDESKTFQMQINQFSDLTEEQFRKKLGGYRLNSQNPPEQFQLQNNIVLKPLETIQANENQDAVAKGEGKQKMQRGGNDENRKSGQAEESQGSSLIELLTKKNRNQNLLVSMKKGENMKVVVQNENSSRLLYQQKIKKNMTADINSVIKKLVLVDGMRQSIFTPTLISDSKNLIIDWTKAAGPVEHQLGCASCYAFVSISYLEAMYALFQNGIHVSLSVQQLLDCDEYGGNLGCIGGSYENSFQYLKKKGVGYQFYYPYRSGLTGSVGKCRRRNTEKGKFKIKDYKKIKSGNCQLLKQQLIQKPVSAVVSTYNWQFYKKGTITCPNAKEDHAVLIVGYDSRIGWRIKNSWGEQWGEKGYGWIKDGPECGICNNAYSISIPNESK